MRIVTVKTTFSKRGEADEVLRRLIEDRIVACAHLMRISSSFNWQGVERSIDEWRIELKTLPEKLDETIRLLEQHHSYEVPMIVWSEETTTEAYGTWMKSKLDE